MPVEDQAPEKETVVAPQEAVPGQREQGTREVAPGPAEVEKGFAVARQESAQLSEQIAGTEVAVAQESGLPSEVSQEITPELAQIRQEAEAARAKLEELNRRKADLDAGLNAHLAGTKSGERPVAEVGHSEEQMARAKQELLERARKRYATEVKPRIDAISQMAEKFSDIDPQWKSRFEDNMKTMAEFFGTFEDGLASLSDHWMKALADLKKGLEGGARAYRNGADFMRAYDARLEYASDGLDLTMYKTSWPVAIRTNDFLTWEHRIKEKLVEAK